MLLTRSVHAQALGLFAALLLTACGDSTSGPPEEPIHDPSRMVTTVHDGEPNVVTEIQVEALDTEGRPFTGALQGLAFEVRGRNAGAQTAVQNLGGGVHVLRYTPAALGFDTLDVTLDDSAVPGSPFASRVRLVLRASQGTPTLDGVMAAGEWDDAPAYAVFSGPLEGSTVRFLTDGVNLYVIFRVPHPEATDIGTASIRFDNTLDLVISGDDVISFLPLPRIVDQFFGEESITNDLEQNGTGAAGSSEGWAYLEFSHPLSSGDPQDIDLASGERVGVCLRYGSELTASSTETSFPADCITVVNQQRTYAELELPSP